MIQHCTHFCDHLLAKGGDGAGSIELQADSIIIQLGVVLDEDLHQGQRLFTSYQNLGNCCLALVLEAVGMVIVGGDDGVNVHLPDFGDGFDMIPDVADGSAPLAGAVNAIALQAIACNEGIGAQIQQGGRILGMEMTDNLQEIIAEVPIAEMLKYATDLRSMTQGRGSFTSEFARYEEVPANASAKIIEDAKKRMKDEE